MKKYSYQDYKGHYNENGEWVPYKAEVQGRRATRAKAPVNAPKKRLQQEFGYTVANLMPALEDGAYLDIARKGKLEELPKLRAMLETLIPAANKRLKAFEDRKEYSNAYTYIMGPRDLRELFDKNELSDEEIANFKEKYLGKFKMPPKPTTTGKTESEYRQELANYRNKMIKELTRVGGFLTSETSTIAGWNEVKKKVVEGVKRNQGIDIDESVVIELMELKDLAEQADKIAEPSYGYKVLYYYIERMEAGKLNVEAERKKLKDRIKEGIATEYREEILAQMAIKEQKARVFTWEEWQEAEEEAKKKGIASW